MKRIQCFILLFAVLFVCSCSKTPDPAETQDIAAILDAAAENGGGVVSRNDGIFKNYENTASGVIVRNMAQTPYGVCLMYCPVGDGISFLCKFLIIPRTLYPSIYHSNIF